MQSHYITHLNSTIHYRQFGRGEKLLFCFHGYGREGYTFSFLESRIGNQYTIIAIDAPHHGHTKWEEEQVFKPGYLITIINQIRASLKKETEKFSLLGFSMGGRIALYLTQALPNLIERLVLMAPDGLNFNLLRSIGTETWLGTKFLKYTIDKPDSILWFINRAEKAGIVTKSLAEFVHYHIDDKEQRMMLFKRWATMRLFKPNLPKLRKLIQKHQIPVRMLFGSFDRVIHSENGLQFIKGIENYASVQVIDAGHNLLNDVHSKTIVKLFND